MIFQISPLATIPCSTPSIPSQNQNPFRHHLVQTAPVETSPCEHWVSAQPNQQHDNLQPSPCNFFAPCRELQPSRTLLQCFQMIDKPLINSAVDVFFELKGLVHPILPLPQGAKHLSVTILSACSKTGSVTYCSCCECQHWQRDRVERIMVIELRCAAIDKPTYSAYTIAQKDRLDDQLLENRMAVCFWWPITSLWNVSNVQPNAVKHSPGTGHKSTLPSASAQQPLSDPQSSPYDIPPAALLAASPHLVGAPYGSHDTTQEVHPCLVTAPSSASTGSHEQLSCRTIARAIPHVPAPEHSQYQSMP